MRNTAGGSQSAGQGGSVMQLCLLARAIIQFNRGHISASLDYLKKMIRQNPRAPSDIWFAIGLCYYRLGNLPKAKLSIDKTISLDPQNSMALSALGVIELASNINDFEVREKALKLFE